MTNGIDDQQVKRLTTGSKNLPSTSRKQSTRAGTYLPGGGQSVVGNRSPAKGIHASKKWPRRQIHAKIWWTVWNYACIPRDFRLQTSTADYRGDEHLPCVPSMTVCAKQQWAFSEENASKAGTNSDLRREHWVFHWENHGLEAMQERQAVPCVMVGVWAGTWSVVAWQWATGNWSAGMVWGSGQLRDVFLDGQQV